MDGKSIILELDANSKLGPTYIKYDPHGMSPNGVILSGITERHGLVVANGVDKKVRGVITRRRCTVLRIEESAIDFVIVSSDIAEDLVTIVVDENKGNILISLTKTKNSIKQTESDHNSIISKFNLKWKEKVKVPQPEIFNFNDKQG